jgi:hypothetical protein
MKSEKGQAIIFLALGFVVFLGFVALAIDGGMLYSDRRQAQNGSDASSLGGAGTVALELSNNSYDYPQATYPGWDCGSYWVQEAEWLGVNAAIARGGSNDFSLDTDQSDLNYVSTACHNSWNGSFWDRWLDVTVGISDTTETTFARVLYPAPLRNVVSSTARVRPRAPFGFGNAIVALREECHGMDGGVRFRGSGDVHITGGSIFSNACFEAGGGPSNTVIVEPEGMNNVCIPVDGQPCWDRNGAPSIDPAPIEGTERIPPSNYFIPTPACGAYRGHVRVTNGGDETIDPGTYDYITVLGGTLYMNPGLYCVMGSAGVSINGGNVYGPYDYLPGAEYPYPTGVSFYIGQGGFSTQGGATIRLTAAMRGACQDIACPGITQSLEAVLIFLGHGNSSEVSLLGTSESDYTGLVYAPNGTVNVGGTSSELSTFNLQVVADTVFIHGTAEMFINYDGDLQRWTSAMIELAR